jgi:hypothetical protein
VLEGFNPFYHMRVFCTSLQVAAEVLLALAVGNYENQVRCRQHLAWPLAQGCICCSEFGDHPDALSSKGSKRRYMFAWTAH